MMQVKGMCAKMRESDGKNPRAGASISDQGLTCS